MKLKKLWLLLIPGSLWLVFGINKLVGFEMNSSVWYGFPLAITEFIVVIWLMMYGYKKGLEDF